jgi:pyruvate dehydrogenase E2 component (dihydrolipoamide acetyltransferase)
VVKVNTIAALLTTKGEDIAAALATAHATNTVLNAATTTPAPAVQAAGAPKPAPNFAANPPPRQAVAKRQARVSPVAARLAAEHGLDLARITGSGPDGRIVRKDVERALADGSARPQTAATPAKTKLRVLRADGADSAIGLSPIRSVIAQRLQAAKSTIPHFYVEDTVDAAALHALRESLNLIDGVRITVNDLIVRGCALALRVHPRINATFDGTTIRQLDSADISIAVALPDGLITPIVFKAHAKGVRQIGEEIRALGAKAQSGRLQPSEFQGGSFTISNLGATGIAAFSAIINPPQVAILAVGTIRDEPVVRAGAVVAGKVLRLTLSADHRAVDGADAALFMKTLRELLENPANLLI